MRDVFALGEMLELSDSSTDARQLYEEAAKNIAENQELRAKLCLLHFKEAFWKEAIQNCSKAVRLDTNDAISWALLGMSYYNSEDRPKAFEEFNQAVKLHPRSNLLRRARGYIFFQEKSFEQAVLELGVATSVDGTDAEGAVLLARSLYALERYDDARVAYYLACVIDQTLRFEFISKQRDLERKNKLDMASKYDETINKI